jgi:hypothetical protein
MGRMMKKIASTMNNLVFEKIDLFSEVLCGRNTFVTISNTTMTEHTPIMIV